MYSEIEVKFTSIDKDIVRNTLSALGGVMDQPNVLMRRAIFHISGDKNSRLRVRDEGNKITMTYKKVIDNFTIDGIKEFEIVVDNFDSGIQFLSSLGYKQKAYQESYREKRLLDGCEICIDERPGLDPFIEIEGPHESIVKSVALKLGYTWKDALFGPVNMLYVTSLGYDYHELNTIDITFGNPLVSKL